MGRDDNRSKSDRDTRNKGTTGQLGGQPGGGIPSGQRGQARGFGQGSQTGGSEADLGQDNVQRGRGGQQTPERRDR